MATEAQRVTATALYAQARVVAPKQWDCVPNSL
jgi:hypothetical protein